MKRREFFKKAGKSLVGCLGLGFIAKEAKAKPEIYINKEWGRQMQEFAKATKDRKMVRCGEVKYYFYYRFGDWHISEAKVDYGRWRASFVPKGKCQGHSPKEAPSWFAIYNLPKPINLQKLLQYEFALKRAGLI